MWAWVFGLGAWAAEPQVTMEVPQVATSADAEVEEAKKLLSDGKFDDAARQLGALADAGGNLELRYLHALAAYEAGDLRVAQRAIVLGQKRDPDDAALLSLFGLIQADLGDGDAALRTFEHALTLVTSNAMRGRVRLNRGIVYLDQGKLALAEQDFLAAKADAERGSADDVLTRARENLGSIASLRGGQGAQDAIGRITERLRTGDVSGARSLIPIAPLGRRAQIEAALAEGAVSRAEGRLDAAAASFERALGLAREGGLLRDTSYALAQLGVVYGLQGRYPLALDRLQEAVGLVAGTSFRVNELSYRVEAGRVAVRLGELDQAKAQLEAAKKVSVGLEDALGVARMGELEGLLLASSDDLVGATRAFRSAETAFAERGYWAEAARIATAVVEMQAHTPEVVSEKERALAYFEKSGDPVGPAHVAFAEGLGLGKRQQADAALKAFAEASRVGNGSGTERGRQVAHVAEQNAAQLLRAMGRTEDLLAQGKGMEAALADADAFQKHETSYEKGRALFDAQRYAEAEQAFEGARKGFEALNEVGYARKAASAAAWSRYNLAISAPAPEGYRIWSGLVEQGRRLEDPELTVRSRSAAALKASELGEAKALEQLRVAAPEAERMGFVGLASQVWTELATKEDSLDARAVAARRAFSLDPGKGGAYAMYAVAVDAYNAEEWELCLSLVEQALPNAGEWSDELLTVQDAARALRP